jgi:chromosome segregation ATPase
MFDRTHINAAAVTEAYNAELASFGIALEANDMQEPATASDLEGARFMVEQLQSLLEQREQEARDQLKRMVDLQRQRDESIAQLRRAEGRIHELESRLSDLSLTRPADDQRTDALAAENETLRAQLAAAASQAEASRRSLEVELAKLKTTLITLQGEYGRLRDDVAPALAKAQRHDRLLSVLPGWIEQLLVRLGSRGT